MKRLIRWLLSILFFLMETLGWFFMYSLAVSFTASATTWAPGVWVGISALSVLSTFVLFKAVLEWG